MGVPDGTLFKQLQICRRRSKKNFKKRKQPQLHADSSTAWLENYPTNPEMADAPTQLDSEVEQQQDPKKRKVSYPDLHVSHFAYLS
jgi:hypothetical protein